MRGFWFLLLTNARHHHHHHRCHLVAVNRYLVALIGISPVTHGAEQVLMCLLATCVSSLEKGLFKSFAHLKMWLQALASVA